MATSLCGVLGHPVGHSRSPAIHNAAYAELGLDWRYVKLPVPPELFEETVRGLPGSGYRGANVTIPHKLAALRLADDASDAARAVGAANTLTFADGRIAAENTDAGGLLDAIDRPVAGLRALVLGAGGAGRAAAWALREAGAAEVAVWNRTPERAAAVAAELDLVHAQSPGASDVLVNATSVGLNPEAAEAEALEQLALTGIDAPPLVVDLVYRVGGITPLQVWAERAGVSFVGGLEVLVRQGARSFELWTGRPAPLETMRAAAAAL
jgi:shikimate dehydrogenase